MNRKRLRFEIVLGAVCIALYAIFSFWYGGWGRGKLTRDEVDAYISKLEKHANVPEEAKKDVLERLRSWGAADDGGPVYMLNLMRAREKPYLFPGAPADFAGTAEEANRLYEDGAMPLLFKRGGIPAVWGKAQGKNVIGGGPGLDDWTNLGFIRYPQRRAFFELLTDAHYEEIGHLKWMGMEFILVPTSAEMAVPDLRLLVGGALLILFLGIGWLRSAVRGGRTRA
ncbi:MAG: hypothetical protein AB1640_25900 [bacterium]